MRRGLWHRLSVLWLVWRLWRRHPCLRFGQLLCYVGRGTDVFYLQDDDLKCRITDVLKER
jgi:hypothetical protein